jgi:hypothetical protein
MTKKKLSKVLVLCFVFIIAILGNGIIARAEEELLSMSFYLPMDNVSDFSDIFKMPEDGSVRLNVTMKDTGTIPGKMDFIIKKKDNNQEYTQVVKTITGVVSEQGIKDLDIDLSKGDYLIEYVLYNDIGDDLSNTSVKLKAVITLNDPPALPAPKNIPQLTTQTVATQNDIKDKSDTIILGGETNELVLPFTTKQIGGILASVKETDYSYQTLTAGVYKDKECTAQIGEDMVLTNGDEVGVLTATLSKKGTYYLKFVLEGYDIQYEYHKFNVTLISVGSETKTLTANKVYTEYQDANKSTFKINVPKSGLVTILTQGIINGESQYNLQILDKNKKKITKVSNVKNGETEDGKYGSAEKYYTLQKGTYYVQVESSSKYFYVRYIFNERTDQSGKKKASAKVLKPGGASAKGYLLNSDATDNGDWYKITVSTYASEIQVEYKLDGAAKYVFYDSKGKVKYSSDLNGGYYTFSHYENYYFDKGTYYVKIYKADKNSSMAYTIKVTK